MREGFWRRNHDPPLKCSDSSRRSTSLSLFGTSGGLIWGPLAASFGVSSLFFLLSSLFSPLSSLLPERAVRCPKGLVPLWRLHCGTSGGLWGSLCSLLSPFCSLLSLLSSLLSRCRSFLRSYFAPAPFDLPIRPATSPPTASTLCGSLPGPAECAKRLNHLMIIILIIILILLLLFL